MSEATNKQTDVEAAISTITRILNSFGIHSNKSSFGNKASLPWIDFVYPFKPSFRYEGEDQIQSDILSKYQISEEDFRSYEHMEAQAFLTR